MTADHSAQGGKHTILIDGREYTFDLQTVSGAQLKAAAAIPSDYQLFLEGPGEDTQVADSASIKLHNNMKFYALPPATFG